MKSIFWILGTIIVIVFFLGMVRIGKPSIGDQSRQVLYQNSPDFVVGQDGLPGLAKDVADSNALKQMLRSMSEQKMPAFNPPVKSLLHQDSVPLVVLSRDHSDYIYEIAVSPDGRHIASRSADKTLKVWDTDLGKAKYTLETKASKEDKAFTGGGTVDFDETGKWVCTTDGKRTILVYEVRTGRRVQEIVDNHSKFSMFDPLSIPIIKARFVPGRREVASSSHDGYIRFWDLQMGGLTQELKIGDQPVVNFSFSRDGHFLTSISQNYTVNIWDLRKKAIFRTFNFVEPVYSAPAVGSKDFAFLSPDNKYLVAGGMGVNTLKVWDIANNKLVWTHRPRIENGTQQVLTSAALAHDGKLLAIGYLERPCRFIDMQDFSSQGTTNSKTSPTIALGFHPGQYALYSAHGQMNQDIMLKSWNAKNGQLLRNFQSDIDFVRSVAVSASGRYLAMGGGSNVVWLWDRNRGLNIQHMQTDGQCRPGSGVYDLIFTPDENYLISAHCEGKIHIWDIRSGLKVRTLQHNEETIFSLAIAPDGRELVSGGADNIIRVWRLADGNLIDELEGHPSAVGKLQFDPTGSVLASASFSQLSVWDWKSKELSASKALNLHYNLQPSLRAQNYMEEILFTHNYTLTFHPDGAHVILGGFLDGDVRQWNWRNGTSGSLVESLGGNPKIVAMAVSRNQQWLALGDNVNFQIKILDLRTGALAATLEQHEDVILDLAFTSEDSILISSSKDGTVRLFNWQKDQERLKLVPNITGEYVMIAPGNYYFSSKGKVEDISFRLQDEYYSFDQFDLFFNRPDLILHSLGDPSQKSNVLLYQKAYEKRKEKLGFDINITKPDFRHIPTIEVDREAMLPLTTQRKILIPFTADGNGSRLRFLKLYINDVPVVEIDFMAENTDKYRGEVPLILSQGTNLIRIYVMNDNNLESLQESFSIYCEPSEYQVDLHLIAIGAAHYRDETMNLDYADDDARDLAALFSGSHPDAYEKIHTTTLCNEQVTIEQIRALKKQLEQTSIDDKVIVFYSGHGLTDEKQNYFLAAYPTDFSDPGKGSIPFEQLENLLADIPARRKLLLIDACNSGEIDKESVKRIKEQFTQSGSVTFRNSYTYRLQAQPGFKVFDLMKELFTDLRRGTGTTVIASANGVELAVESAQWQNGVFTYCLKEGLQRLRADANKDGTITISELQGYISRRVAELTDFHQRPNFRKENTTNNWSIW